MKLCEAGEVLRHATGDRSVSWTSGLRGRLTSAIVCSVLTRRDGSSLFWLSSVSWQASILMCTGLFSDSDGSEPLLDEDSEL